MPAVCHWCRTEFEVTEDDLAFYEKVSPIFKGKKYLIPSPTLCPECRQQRRLVWRNERHLYQRKSSLTGETLLSIYSPLNNVVVHEHEEWFKDRYDPRDYGRDVDFSKSFSEQFRSLLQIVPRLSLHVLGNENCSYVSHCGYSKNCYLSYNCDFSENCYYCTNVIRSRDCLDIFNGDTNCELCYDSLDIQECYNVIGSQNCRHSNNLFFCYNLSGCSNCFGCVNLRNKEYCFFNEQMTKEGYLQKISQYPLGSWQIYSELKQKMREHSLRYPRKYGDIVQCENVVGDHLSNCKNTIYSFDCFADQDIAYCTTTSTCKDSRDWDIGGYESELCLEMVSSGDKDYHCLFTSNAWGNDTDVYYSDLVIGCKNCFGCVSMRNKSYCILNKQYSKEEYEALVPKIIEKMQADGEWGEFFPPSLSPFGYNETVAMEYFPLTKEEALAKGFNWSDYEPPPPKVEKVITQEQMRKLPDNIKDIPDEILNWALTCEVSNKPFRIIKQELLFYREHNLPIPRRHPDQRHKDRMALRNPRKLYERQCDCAKEEHNHSAQVETRHGASLQSEPNRCPTTFQTTYSPERPEKVYCEACYLKEVY